LYLAVADKEVSAKQINENNISRPFLFEFTKGATKMFKHKLFAIALILVLVSSLAVWVGTSKATPASGVTVEPIGAGTLPSPIDAKFKLPSGVVHTDVSKITMAKVTIAPAGDTGWHQHGGPIWVVIASGTLTLYDGDDPSCTGVVYPPGSAFMDPGNHTHIARNEGSENLVVYAVYMTPAGGALRIDVPAPGNCPF
jgi:quercetin dioxygenase-like cupin family protein